MYDLIYDEKTETLRVALEAYREVLEDKESAEELKAEFAFLSNKALELLEFEGSEILC